MSSPKKPPRRKKPPPEKAPLTPEKTGLITTDQLAEKYGVTKQRVGQWVTEGCPLASADRPRMFDPEAVDAWYAGTFGSSAQARLDLNQERARLARRQAEKLELELALLRRQALDSQEVVLAVAEIAAAFRSNLEGKAASIAADVGLTREQTALMQESLREVLRHTVDRLETLFTGEGGNASGDSSGEAA